jgi:hypothetical protein
MFLLQDLWLFNVFKNLILNNIFRRIMESNGYKANLLFLEAPTKGASHFPSGKELFYADKKGEQRNPFPIGEGSEMKAHILSSEEIIQKLIMMFKGQLINTQRESSDKCDS